MNQEVMSGESKPLARSDRAVSATPLTIGPSWLLPTKAIPPPVPRDYFAPRTLSPTLESILERRITILQAPVGFGKTTALAHVAERLKERGTAVAWLSLDEEDAPETFASYIAQALERAGVDVAAVAEDKGWTGLPFFRQLGFLARLVEAHDRDCLFVLDEVDRLPAATLEWVNYLLKRSPGNLHFALACRSSPGLDLISPMLDGSAVLIEKEALRLSGKEIARFYGGSLSRRTLAEVWERTAGWPVALVIDRSRRFAGNGAMNNHGPILSSDMVGASLLRRMSTEDRVVLYEFAVLDGVSANLVEEVLGTSEARRRVSALVSHERLVLPSKNGEDSHRLHPLIREYCANRLAIEYPARKRRLHHGIALALARQGDVSGAWRHALDAQDDGLVGDLVERVGVFGLWLREGERAVATASRTLSPETISGYPRAALLRCVDLQFASEFEQATKMYESVARQTEGFAKDRAGGNQELAIDGAFAEVVLAGGWRTLPEDKPRLRSEAEAPGGDSEQERVLDVARSMMRCVRSYDRAHFTESGQHGQRARARFGANMKYGDAVVCMYLGMGAMAAGRIPSATEWYRSARRIRMKHLPMSQELTEALEALTMEIDFERNPEWAIRIHRPLKRLAEPRPKWHEGYAAAVAIRAESLLLQEEPGAAVDYLATVVDAARAKGVRSLVAYATALFVLFLVKAGRADEAGQVWKDHGLPCDTADLLDVERLGWRVSEALSSARTALLAARGEADLAAELADTWWRGAEAAGNYRTAGRALGFAMAVAHQAGRENEALSRLTDLLRIARRVGYYRSVAIRPDVTRALLQKLRLEDQDQEVKSAAETAQRHLNGSSSLDSKFSVLELEVLADVKKGLTNKEIATFLGISNEGVRYHLKNIYRKAGVSSRAEAVRQAEAMGLVC